MTAVVPPSAAVALGEFDQVCKWYGPVIGLNDVTLTIQPGITGLVGHNGAGKSTLIKLLTGQLRPSVGRVTVQGQRAWTAAAKRYIGYCPDVDAFYEEMSGRAFVTTMARLHGFPARAARACTESVLARVGMADRADRPLASYSKGMRQRIKLAQALVHDPRLIVLDEPLNGVDPVGRSELIHLFRELRDAGKAILISSHILDELDTLADRIFFIGRGRILASGTLDQVRAMLDEHPLKIRLTMPGIRRLAVHLFQMPMVQGIELTDDDNLLANVNRPQEFFRQLAVTVVEQQCDVERLQVVDASTEAIFDYLMAAANHPR